MDALALVCTLYADGPRSLRRLREGGCCDLAALRGLDAPRLAGLLRWSEPDARRLLREARALGERLGLDPEERHQPLLDPHDPSAAEREVSAEPAILPAASVPTLAQEPSSVAPRGSAPARTTPAPEREAAPVLTAAGSGVAPADRRPTAPRGERELVSAVVARWTEEDRRARISAARVAGRPDPTAAAAAGRATDTGESPLGPGVPEGLRPAEAEVLSAAGIRTLPALAGADPTELALATGLPFVRIRRLQFAAGRAGADAPR